MKLTYDNAVFKNTLIAATITTVLGTGNAMAGTESFGFSITSIQDVAVTERQAMVMGSALKIDATGQCGFPALSTTTDDWDTGEVYAIANAETRDQALTGSGCADTSSTTSNYGTYLVTGAANTAIKVTLNDGSSQDGDGNATTDFTFEPVGIIDVALGAGVNSPATALPNETQKTVTLGTGGEAGIVVGGNLIVGVGGLTAGQTLTGSFDIEVVY